MRLAVMLGRGVEGCGVTKNVVELLKYFPTAKVFATKDKMWPRINSMPIERRDFMASSNVETDQVIREINENFDALVVYSLPSVKHPTEAIDNFLRLLQSVTIPKSLVQVDHNVASITRNARLPEMCNAMDLLMTHSLYGSFATWGQKNGIVTPTVTMGVGFDYDAHRAKYWKPISDQDDKTLRWIGRCAMWKGPVEVIELHNKYLRQHGFITVLEGLEASVQSLLVTHEDGFARQKPRDVQEYIRGQKRTRSRAMIGKEVHGTAPYLYPDYKNEACMDRLSRSAFGSDLYNLKAHYYGDNIEYCHAEVVASGTVPLFHKHFGDNITHRGTGERATARPSGTIWYDPENPEATAAEILSLSADRVKRDEARERAFEFWKQHSDGKIIYEDIVYKAVNAREIAKTTPSLAPQPEPKPESSLAGFF